MNNLKKGHMTKAMPLWGLIRDLTARTVCCQFVYKIWQA